ncbi:MAG: hypothetical protein ABS76_21635 [Pelagibacterium sp. SCN 64-44]|nr:MAG: hypothetical protein ABS76_21635 [Pelagibacterium sp. SCN 64-44]
MAGAPHILDGVTVPLVTPMDADRRPDAALAKPLLATMDAAGIDTLMLLGSNGEGALIPAAAAARFARETADLWRGMRGERSRLFVTVFGAGTAIGLENARALMAARPDALVVAAPLYFIHTEDELADHFASFAAFGVPVIVYNIPRYTGNPITLSLLGRLAGMPHIVGMKDSGGNDQYLLDALAATRNNSGFAISQGNEKRLGWALLEGARGITPGLANIAPALCVALAAAARKSRMDEVEALQARLTALTAIHSLRPGVAAMKAALHLLGLAPMAPAAPFRPYSPTELEQLRAVLARMQGDVGGHLRSGE